jgi:hypothetical protein
MQVAEPLAKYTAATAAAAAAAPLSHSRHHLPQQQQQQQQQLDKSGWWGELARAAYAAVDGSLEGYEEPQIDDSSTDSQAAGLSGPEAEMVKVGWLFSDVSFLQLLVCGYLSGILLRLMLLSVLCKCNHRRQR